MSASPTPLARRLAAIMQERNLSQHELARLSGVSVKTINRLIHGKAADPRTLLHLAEFSREPAAEWFRLAGYLPEAAQVEAEVQLALHLLEQLPEASRRRMIEILRLEHKLAEEQRRREGTD